MEYILLLGLIIILILLSISIFNHPIIQSWIKGKTGEAKVKTVLERTKSPHKKIINNIVIKTEDQKTSQIDHILINEYGIFVIETKNYAGKIYGMDYANEWKQYLHNKPYPFRNPIKQNHSHICRLKEILGEEYPYFSIIVFVQNNVQKINSPIVMGINQLEQYLNSFSEQTLSEQDIEKIYQELKSINQIPIITNHQHIQNIQEIQKNLENNICPRCGSELIKKNGAYGEFYACSSYPQCNFTKKISSEQEVLETPATQPQEPQIVNIADNKPKKLQCSICESYDMTMHTDHLICDQCGCKYPLEEAKKML